MSKKINRRSFIKKSAVFSASSVIGSTVMPGVFNRYANAESSIDLAAVKGENYFENTIKAVDFLGGMKKFVSKGSTIGLLANSPWKNIGTYTNPDIVLAIIKLCYEAGAKEIVSIEGASDEYWKRGSLAQKFAEEIKSLKSGAKDYTMVSLRKGKNLKEASIKKVLLECDVFINIPITKDHNGTRFTGCLKNMMGASAYDPTNHFIHFGNTGKSWKDGGYKNVPFLSQSIADLGLVRKPDLCISDATEMILTNGPAGPGKMNKPQYVVAGTDPVAVDSYCANFLNLKGSEILMLKAAHEHGLGEIDTKKLVIKEA
jgi:uncharacterized protein (DUF362 family)